MSGLLMQI